MIEDTTRPHLVNLPTFADARGQLGVVEAANLPFEIRRLYYLFDVPIGAVRGEHGHKKLQQLLICMNGICEVILNDGTGQFHFRLETPAKGLYVPPGMWRSLRFHAAGTVICVLASRPFEREDYIYHFEEFLAWAKESRSQQGQQA